LLLEKNNAFYIISSQKYAFLPLYTNIKRININILTFRVFVCPYSL